MRFGWRREVAGWHLLTGVALLLLCATISATGKKAREPKWWSIAKIADPSNLISNHIKSNSLTDHYLDPAIHRILRKKQRRLVRENPGVLVAIAKGARHAVHECKHQFRNRRWNCSTSSSNRSKRLFGKIVSRGMTTNLVISTRQSITTHNEQAIHTRTVGLSRSFSLRYEKLRSRADLGVLPKPNAEAQEPVELQRND
ncbi:protein wingless-like [Penaeus indicus]|uniref:protein wingless-like n=1 Tax=Penaeus indicus TaxID=29960 RepID=UPI00300C25BB